MVSKIFQKAVCCMDEGLLYSESVNNCSLKAFAYYLTNLSQNIIRQMGNYWIRFHASQLKSNELSILKKFLAELPSTFLYLKKVHYGL